VDELAADLRPELTLLAGKASSFKFVKIFGEYIYFKEKGGMGEQVYFEWAPVMENGVWYFLEDNLTFKSLLQHKDGENLSAAAPESLPSLVVLAPWAHGSSTNPGAHQMGIKVAHLQLRLDPTNVAF
jgi:hypothetical protein